jgi:hypothetical protein
MEDSFTNGRIDIRKHTLGEIRAIFGSNNKAIIKYYTKNKDQYSSNIFMTRTAITMATVNIYRALIVDALPKMYVGHSTYSSNNLNKSTYVSYVADLSDNSDNEIDENDIVVDNDMDIDIDIDIKSTPMKNKSADTKREKTSKSKLLYKITNTYAINPIHTWKSTVPNARLPVDSNIKRSTTTSIQQPIIRSKTKFIPVDLPKRSSSREKPPQKISSSQKRSSSRKKHSQKMSSLKNKHSLKTHRISPSFARLPSDSGIKHFITKTSLPQPKIRFKTKFIVEGLDDRAP